MGAALICTVHDFLGYGYVSGQVCHEHCGCVKCMDDTTYHQLSNEGSSKTVFVGHRRWLHDQADEWRSRKKCLFNNKDETRGEPRMRSGEEIYELFDGWKECPEPGKKRK